MGFQSLRVINDDRVAAGGGFPEHPHRDMEIFSYVLEGSLAHRDSLGNERTLKPGQIQLMSAGTGVRHSEFNPSNTDATHFLQVWIQPRTSGLSPTYTEWHPDIKIQNSPKVLVISPDGREGSACIQQDVSIYRLRLKTGESVSHELIADHVEQVSEILFADFLREAIFEPLGMTKSFLNGSASRDVVSCVDELAEFALELRNPQLISTGTASLATTTQFAELEGVVPGVGRFDPCNWGLGPELHGTKHPHWMGSRNSASTFGHFGGTGSFMWHDPTVNISCIGLCEVEFDAWAMHHWPIFFDAVVNELSR
ncbi:MAG: cupin domain-containing protein [Actinobacteria bacterium]|nr:cupin domain-containing protein [Actinomycetota bacterium]